MESSTHVLTLAERSSIRAPAKGDRSQLNAAAAAFNRAAPKYGIESCVELKFMAEVLAPVSDLSLRAIYRKAVQDQPEFA